MKQGNAGPCQVSLTTAGGWRNAPALGALSK